MNHLCSDGSTQDDIRTFHSSACQTGSPLSAGLWRGREMLVMSGWPGLLWGHKLWEGPAADPRTLQELKKIWFLFFQSQLRSITWAMKTLILAWDNPPQRLCWPVPLLSSQLDVLMYCCGLGHWRRVQSTYVSDHRSITCSIHAHVLNAIATVE